MAIDFEHLLNGLGDDETADDALVADQDDAVFEFETGRGGPALHRFAGVFNLKQSSIWAESCDSVVVPSSAWLHNLTSPRR